jgi:hypothetical protein
MTTLKQAVLNAKVADAFGITRLCARKHKTYNGPVYRLPSGSLWIFYNDEPVEVYHMPSSEGWKYAEAC